MPHKEIVFPTPEQRSKEQYVIKSGKIRKKYKTVIEKYHASGSLNDSQLSAAETLYCDARIGGVLSNMRSMDYTKLVTPVRGRPGEQSWKQAHHHRRFLDAMFSPNIGRMNREVLWHVVIMDCEISSFTRISRSFAAIVLREALTDLAEHYRKPRKRVYEELTSTTQEQT
jgi:hypothetical protein